MSDFGEYRGIEVRGYLASDDVSTPVEIKLRPIDFDGSTYNVLETGDRLVIDSIWISNGATAASYTLFQDLDGSGTLDAGEEIFSATLDVNTHANPNVGTPYICNSVVAGNAGGKIYIVSSVGSVGSFIQFNGRVCRA